MRLIDADAFKQRNKRLLKCDFPYISEETLEELIDDAPTIEERKKGKWEKRGLNLYRCSECARFSPTQENFCPTCGADMRKENDNG